MEQNYEKFNSASNSSRQSIQSEKQVDTFSKPDYSPQPSICISSPDFYTFHGSQEVLENNPNWNIDIGKYGSTNHLYDPSSEEEDEFADILDRHLFLGKVFSLLSVQISILTATVVGISSALQPVSEELMTTDFIVNHFDQIEMGLLILYIGTAVYAYVITRQEGRKLMKRTPWNYILLLTLVCLMAINIGFQISFFSHPRVMLYFGGALVAVCLAFGLLSCQSKLDLTNIFVGLLCIVLVIGITSIIFSLIVSGDEYESYLGHHELLCIALFVSVYFYSFVQIMIRNGVSRVGVSPKEYVLAVTFLFSGIIFLSCFPLVLIIVIGSSIGYRYFSSYGPCFSRKNIYNTSD